MSVTADKLAEWCNVIDDALGDFQLAHETKDVLRDLRREIYLAFVDAVREEAENV